MIRERLAEGYRKRTERDARICRELDEAGSEAYALPGDVPAWETPGDAE